MKKTLKLGAIALVALSLSSCMAGRFMAHYALTPKPHGVEDIERTRHKADSLEAGSTAWFDGLMAQGIMKETTIVGNNDKKIYAAYAPAKCPETANGTAMIIHGYTDNHFVFIYLARMYRDVLNYNIIMPDLQYHGYSEGDAAQMGWLDRLDVMKWIEVAHDVFKDDFMVLHGVSMGAATVMFTSGEQLPSYVKCFVEDCGYNSVWGQFTKNLKEMNKMLPPKAILSSASIVTNKEFGWRFQDADASKALAKCEKPMLFIHGSADDFVAFEDLEKNFRAKTHGYKVKWVAEGAVHANSYAKYPEEYTNQVREFLKTCHNMVAVGNL